MVDVGVHGHVPDDLLLVHAFPHLVGREVNHDPTGASSLCLVPFACSSLFLPRQDAGWVTAAPSVRVTLSGIYDVMS